MRFLDITVAALIGMTAVTGITIWSPVPADAVAQRQRTISSLRDSLTSFVDHSGVALLATASLSSICGAATAASATNFTVSVEVGTESCKAPPPAPYALVQFSFTLDSRKVTLLAWSAGAA